MNFIEGQKAMAVAAVIHESRLQRGFDPHHLGQINVAFKLSFGGCFKIEINQPLAIDNDDAGFFRMRRVNQHTRRHIFHARRDPARNAGCHGP